MSSVSDRYIYLTQKHYVNSGQYDNDITYMNSLHNQLYKQIETKLDNNMKFEYALNNLYNNFTNSNIKYSNDMSNLLQDINVNNADEVIKKNERELAAIQELLGEGGEATRILSEIQSIMSETPSAAKIQRIFSLMQKFNVKASSVVGICNNTKLNKSMEEFNNFVRNFYSQNCGNLQNVIDKFNSYLKLNFQSCISQLNLAYLSKLKSTVMKELSYDIMNDLINEMKKMGWKFNKLPNKPISNLNYQRSGNTFKITLPKRYQISPPNIKQIQLNNSLTNKIYNFNNYTISDFEYHYANLAAKKIQDVKTNNSISFIGQDLAKETNKLLGIRTLLNETDLLYSNKTSIKMYNLNTLLNKTTEILSSDTPWNTAIKINDKRFFGNNKTTDDRVNYILTQVHQEKIRIALNS